MELCLETTSPARRGPEEDPLAPLVRQVAAGSESALGAIYDTAGPWVLGLALRILRDRAAAEEVTLDVFVQVWRLAGRYDPAKGHAGAWILTLARSRAIDLLRSRNRRPAGMESIETAAGLVDGNPGPEQASLESERTRRVRRAMEELPRDQRRVIEAVYFGGLSHTEVASALGQPLGTVKTRIRAGMATLKKTLAPGERLA